MSALTLDSVRFIAVALGIVAFIWIGAMALTKMRRSHIKGKSFELSERIALSPRASVCVVQMKTGERLILGVTDQAVTLLLHQESKSAQSNSAQFQTILRQEVDKKSLDNAV